jgi:hypothetical protein
MFGRNFKVIMRVSKITKDEAKNISQELVKYFQDADVNYEFWAYGAPKGVANYEFTTQYACKTGEGEQRSEELARICAKVVWTTLGDCNEAIKVKVAPFSDFCATSTIYVLDASVYWCDVWDEEFVEALAEGAPEKVLP